MIRGSAYGEWSMYNLYRDYEAKKQIRTTSLERMGALRRLPLKA
jgi:hypothetical protein